MRSSLFPIRIIGAVGAIALMVLLVVPPARATFLQDPEPSPRPTATPAPYVELTPVSGVAGVETAVLAQGAFWVPGQPVTLYWDDPDDPTVLLGTITAAPDGTFSLEFVTPTTAPYGNPGIHIVYAEQGSLQVIVDFELLAPTPTNTPTPLPPTNTPTATLSPTPVSPTPTASATPTLTPSPTLRAVTPMVTITPFPPTQPPPRNTPVPTRTRATLQGTPTATRTPTQTPGPGTPTAVVQQATPTPVGEMADTGVGMGTVFLWGSVLAGLLMVFRLLRVRALPG
jgi:hypothetical protein